ncbi:hypothetical protein [uncultured Oscillibacter sp.]|uniref:hypothetical protein n=1 Tax=uncultured Oscillibacter sp. TaxID=876091 RepID=UPI0025F0FF6D|nr:hypothetical protein [uncultured Oscillibacter sp.]
MRAWVKRVMDRWGQSVRVETADFTGEVRAFFQPLAQRSERVPSAVTALGWVDERLWLYLGGTKVSPGDRLAWNGQRFRVRSARPYGPGNTALFWWALAEAEKEAVT